MTDQELNIYDERAKKKKPARAGRHSKQVRPAAIHNSIPDGEMVTNEKDTKSLYSTTDTADFHPTRVMSMGAGVQTTALVLMLPERYQYVIFADTGDEKKETYWYIENYLKPYCKAMGIKWATVKNPHYDTLMDKCLDRKILPIRARRWCTDDFKIKPIHRFMRKIGATATNPVHTDIGISIDESHRVNTNVKNPRYEIREYPLLDYNVTRKECYEIIKAHGFPIPVKSGCDFCMFNKRSSFLQLAQKDPDRYKKIVAMERNDRFYPHKPLNGTRVLDANLTNNDSLLDSMSEEERKKFMAAEKLLAETDDAMCDSGHCFL